jgi:CheY-like chemotaxis protein
MGQHTLKRILYAEDEADIQEVARLALEDVGGFEAEIVGDGTIALERARESRPDLILLDVMMPGKDGISTFKELRENSKTREIPVVMLTAKTNSDEVEQFKELGIDGVIFKPFDPMTLAGEVQRVWDQIHAG